MALSKTKPDEVDVLIAEARRLMSDLNMILAGLFALIHQEKTDHANHR